MSKLSRRSFISRASGLTGYLIAASAFKPFAEGVAYAASACTANSKILVHVFLDGGMDSASFLVPRNLQSYLDMRPNIAITDSLEITPALGLHPRLTSLHSLLLQGRAAVINKVGYPRPTRSHEDSKKVYERGLRNAGAVNTGWAGRFADTYCSGDNLFSLVSFRGRAKDLDSTRVVATTAGSLSSFGYNNDSDFNDSAYRRAVIRDLRAFPAAPAGAHDASLRAAWDVVDNSVTTIQALNRSYTSPVVYANDSLSQRFRDAAKIIKSGENPSIILLAQGGYDTHGDSTDSLNSLFNSLNNAVGSFVADLENMGRQNDVMIEINTEFGRNTFENSTRGTDHGHGTVVTLIGPGLRAGVHGNGYVSEDFSALDFLPSEIDFREIRAQILARHLGVDPHPVLPEAFTPVGLALFV